MPVGVTLEQWPWISLCVTSFRGFMNEHWDCTQASEHAGPALTAELYPQLYKYHPVFV